MSCRTLENSLLSPVSPDNENTDRKITADAPCASEVQLNAIFQQAGVGIAQIESQTGQFTRINNKYCNIVGYSDEEMTNTTFMQITHPEDLEEDLNLMKRLIAGDIREFSIQKRYFHKDKSIVWVNLTVSPMWKAGEKPDYHIAIVEDITERKRYEEVLEQTNKDLFLAQRIANVGNWTLDPDIGVPNWSEEVYRIYERDPERGPCPLEDYRNIYKGIWFEKFSTSINKALHEGQPYDIELRLELPSNKVKWVHAICEPELVSESKGYYLRGTIQDITERKIAEKEKEELLIKLQQANKMQAVGTLAGGIAHEFNNLLGIIMGSADMASNEVAQESFVKAQLDNVIKASFRARDLVRQILTFSRQSQRQQISSKICRLVKESVELIQPSIPSSVEIKSYIDSDCGNSMIDPTEIQQIVMNICSNAVYSMKEKGVLTINLSEVELTSCDELIQKGLTAGNYAKLVFSDTGCGMDKETLSQIFNPFFTTKEVGQGTGMGLSIVYGIMESYGGAITVESEVGQGATFQLYFPLTNEADEKKSEISSKLPKGDEHILFVDDEKIYAKVLVNILSRLGYRVDMHLDSREALQAFKTSPDAYDLIITDQVMPDLSGEELIMKAREIRSEIPIILCTGYSSQMNDKKARLLGINAFAFKPISEADLARLIRKVFNE